MGLRDKIKKILKEETTKDLTPHIEKLLNKHFVIPNNDIVCGVKVTHPDKRYKLQFQEVPFDLYRIDIIFIGGYGSKFWPRTMAVIERYDTLSNKAFDLIMDMFGIFPDVYAKYTDKCDQDENMIRESKETKSEVLLNKIKDYGLFTIARTLGGVKKLFNIIDYKDLTQNDKIKFIQDITLNKLRELDMTGELSLSNFRNISIPYDSYGETSRFIASFNFYGMKILTLKDGYYGDTQWVPYHMVPPEIIDRVFQSLGDYLDEENS
jgi:hypothetical protein